MPNPVFSALARFVPPRSVAAGRWKRPSDGKTLPLSNGYFLQSEFIRLELVIGNGPTLG